MGYLVEMGLLLTVSYDGTNYCGWQDQRNGKTVQEVLYNAAGKVFNCKMTSLGASRTDAGVHALGQRIHFILSKPNVIPIGKIPLVINGYLPDDIRIIAATEVSDNFHPINEVKSKTYRYTICNTRFANPILRNYTAHVGRPLDTVKMTDAVRYFIGEHDFAAFCATGTSVTSTVRTIYQLEVARQGDVIEITISGNGFLYNMVRIIAGTLVNVGISKIRPDDIVGIIVSRERIRAGKTMPPQGLALLEIVY